jgi:adenine-specific DNA-methyltransferase
MNSNLYFFLFKNILPKLRGDFYEPSSIYFTKFPVIISNEVIVSKIESLVEKRIKSAENTTHLDSQIDLLVYKLYGLTYEEVLLVDPDFEMEAEAYVAYEV